MYFTDSDIPCTKVFNLGAEHQFSTENHYLLPGLTIENREGLIKNANSNAFLIRYPAGYGVSRN